MARKRFTAEQLIMKPGASGFGSTTPRDLLTDQ